MQNEKITLIKTLKQLDDLLQYLDDKTLVAFDTETTSAERGAKVIGMSFCAELNAGYYVVLSYWDPVNKKLIELETKEGAKQLVQKLLGKSLIMQNAVFDCTRVEENYGVDLMPYVHTD